MGNDAVPGDSLVGRKILIKIIEPYDIATKIGDPLLAGSVVRFETTEDGGRMWIWMGRPIEDEGRVGHLVIVSPRHAGVHLLDLFVEDDIAAGAGLVSDNLANRPIKEISHAEARYFAIVTLRLVK